MQSDCVVLCKNSVSYHRKQNFFAVEHVFYSDLYFQIEYFAILWSSSERITLKKIRLLSVSYFFHSITSYCCCLGNIKDFFH